VWLNAVSQIAGVILVIGTGLATVVGIGVAVRQAVTRRRAERVALGRDVAAAKQRAAQRWRDTPGPPDE